MIIVIPCLSGRRLVSFTVSLCPINPAPASVMYPLNLEARLFVSPPSVGHFIKEGFSSSPPVIPLHIPIRKTLPDFRVQLYDFSGGILI